MYGFGSLLYADGSTYTGSFIDGKPHGEFIKQKF